MSSHPGPCELSDIRREVYWCVLKTISLHLQTGHEHFKFVYRNSHLNDWDVFSSSCLTTETLLLKQCTTYPEISHMINPPELKCPQFPFLHQPIAVRTTTATTADVKNTRHRSWLLHLHQKIDVQIVLTWKILAFCKSSTGSTRI